MIQHGTSWFLGNLPHSHVQRGLLVFFFLWYLPPFWSGILLDDSFLFFQAMIAIIFNLIIASFDWFILEINLWIFFLSPVRKGAKIWKRRMSVWAPHLYCLDIGRIQNLIKADILLKLNSNHLFKSDTYYTYSRSQTSLPCSMYCISPCCRGRSLSDPSRKVLIYNID